MPDICIKVLFLIQYKDCHYVQLTITPTWALFQITSCPKSLISIIYIYISNKINRLLAFLNRNLPRANHRLQECSYKQLVLPVLDYCATIWVPNSIHRIEMQQNRAAHFVLNCPWRGYHHDSISSMISTLNWESLQTRKRNARLILPYKIFHDYQTISYQYLSTFAPLNTRQSEIAVLPIKNYHMARKFYGS